MLINITEHLKFKSDTSWNILKEKLGTLGDGLLEVQMYTIHHSILAERTKQDDL